MNIIEYIISSIAPHSCVQCGVEGDLLCHHCTQNLPAIGSCCYACKCPDGAWKTCANCQKLSPLSAVIAATPYADEAKRLLYILKYDRAAAAARDVAAAIVRRLQETPLPTDLLVTHVPTAHPRIRQRGYDQSALVAKEVARRLGLPYAPLLQRLGTQRQVGKRREERKAQMVLAFRPVRVPLVVNKPVMLIDDVLTTGATLEAAGRVLREAGAGDVQAAVFARA